MNLDDFKKREILRNDLIELTTDHTSEFGKSTRPAYFYELQESELPEMWRNRHPEPPYIVIACYKDKNGCTRDHHDIPLKDILRIYSHGQSNLSL